VLAIIFWHWQRRKSKSKSKLYYVRQSVSQSVLASDTHLGPATNFMHFLFDYFFRQFRVCWCGVPFLTRSRVCTFQFLPGIASAIFLRSESHGIHEYSLLSLFLRLPQPWGPGSCIYFPQEQGSPIIPWGIESAQKTLLSIFIYSFVAVKSWLFEQPLLNNGCCVIACFAIVEL
jgi:hypothetical protein